jgi:hypothetical protein
MHTTTRTRPVAQWGSMKWRGALLASVECLQAAVCSKHLEYLRIGIQSEECEIGRVASRSASPSAMLVESDVCQYIYGIVP